MHPGERKRVAPTALAVHKGWEMAICRSKFKEGSQAPRCTSQLLWQRGSGTPPELWQALKRAAAHSTGQVSSATAMRTLTQPGCFAYRPHVYTVQPQKKKCEHHINSHLQQLFSTGSCKGVKPVGQGTLFPPTDQQDHQPRPTARRGRFAVCQHSHATSVRRSQVTKSEFEPHEEPGPPPAGSGWLFWFGTCTWPQRWRKPPPASGHHKPQLLLLLQVPHRRAPQLRGRHHSCRLHHKTAEAEQQQQRGWTIFTATAARGTRHFYQPELAQKNRSVRAEHLSCTFPPSMRLSAGGTKTQEQSMAVRKKWF